MSKINIISVLILSVLLSLAPLARTQVNTVVMVLDEETGIRVEGATILTPDSVILGVTGSDGVTSFTISDGQLSIRVSHLSYQAKDIVVPEEEIPGDSELTLKIGLTGDTKELPIVPVTGRRYAPSGIIGERVSVLTREQALMSSFGNLDNALVQVPGVFVNRSNGIFSKNTSVSLRGTASAHRTLILVDGIPLNKLSGSALNWHMLTERNTAGIEIMKGPGSSLYGTNAMGGIIHVRTEKNLREEVRIGIERSSYNSNASFATVSRKLSDNTLLSLWGSYRQGDGYINVAPETRDTIHVPLRLYESSAGVRLRQLQDAGSWEIEYLFYNDHRGLGRKVFETDGEYLALQNHHINLRSRINSVYWNIRLNAYQHFEIHREQNENLNSTGKYKLVDTYSQLQDRGIWLQGDRRAGNHAILLGFEVRHGGMDEEVIYRSSTDHLNYGGNIMVAGIYSEDQWTPLPNIIIRGGVRTDLSYLGEGFFNIFTPSSATGFSEEATRSYSRQSSFSVNPMVSIAYRKGTFSSGLSASQGFMPPRLDDLYKSGKISKGFKVGNPELQAERLRQAAIDLSIERRTLDLSLSGYFSQGLGFHYLVATGDTIDMGADGLRPVLQRNNIPEVLIRGVEMGFSWKMLKWLKMNGGISRQRSTISKFPAQPDPANDITNRDVAEVPAWLGNLAVSANYQKFDAQVMYVYTGDQWADDRNSTMVPAYQLLNGSVAYRVTEGLFTQLAVWNLLDKPFTDRKGNYSPGRFITFSITYHMKLTSKPRDTQ